MARRLIKAIYGNGYEAKIYYASGNHEYIVEFWKGGKKHLKSGDYFTDDKADAVGMAEGQLDRFGSNNPDHVPRMNSIKPSHKAPAVKKPRTIGQPSQRARTTKTGKTTKKPSERLMARRKKDTIPGYYPNPVQNRDKEALDHYIKRAFASVRGYRGNNQLQQQAAVSYAQGLLAAGKILGVLSSTEHARLTDLLKSAMGT